MPPRPSDLDADVIVVGGAVAGAAVANAFGSLGAHVLLFEKLSREVHSTRGDLLHPPTLRFLDRWGVLSDLHADGAVPITELAVSHTQLGLVARYPINPVDDSLAGSTIAVPHDRIEAVLFRRATEWPTVRAQRALVTSLERDDRGSVRGVRFRPRGSPEDVTATARLVVGCDGAQSMVRQSVGIDVEAQHYLHEELIVGGYGVPELPNALHWYLDELGGVGVAPRPREECRLLLVLMHGQRGDLLQAPDPGVHDYIVGRFPALAPLRFGKSNAHVYRLSRHCAPRFWAPGAALVGDAAHATHPAGATGMSLAISGAARLSELLMPALHGGSPAALDEALAAFDAERRPAVLAAIEANHAQALRQWESGLHRDPDAFARAVDPGQGWGVGNAGWGKNPAALSMPASA